MAMSVVEIVAVLFESPKAPRGAAMNWNASVLISNVSLAARPAFGRAARSRNVSLMSSAGMEAGRFSAIAVSCPVSAGGPEKRSVRKPWRAVEFPRTAAASPNCEDGVAVHVGVIEGLIDGLMEGLVVELALGLVEGLLEVVGVVDTDVDVVGDTLDELVTEGLVVELALGLIEGLLEEVGVDDCVGVDV